MDIVVAIIDGVARIYQKIPPGTYEIRIDRLVGYEQVLYNEGGVVTSSVTFETGKKEPELFAEATGQATLIVKEMLPDGTEIELPDSLVKYIVIFRSDETGADSGIHMELQHNRNIFSNLPYHFNEVTQQADGPLVSLAINKESLPDHYIIRGNYIVTQRLSSQQAENNEFVFFLIYKPEQVWHVYDGNAPIYNSFYDTDETGRFLGIDSGIFTMKKKE